MSSDYNYVDNVLDTVSAIKEITILSTCISIRGNGPGDYAFIAAKDTLESCKFEKGSQLQDIQPYSFYQCVKLRSINLSGCLNLTLIDARVLWL